MSLGSPYASAPRKIRSYLPIDEAVAMVTVLILCHEYGQNTYEYVGQKGKRVK